MNVSAEAVFSIEGNKSGRWVFWWCSTHFIIAPEPVATRWARDPSRMKGLPSLEFESLFDFT